jgi:hypothetical protein
MTHAEQVEYLLDTHPRRLSPEERDLARPNMEQLLLLMQELNLTFADLELQFATHQRTDERYN